MYDPYANAENEGVIKFSAEHTTARLCGEMKEHAVQQLMAWRLIMVRTELLGRSPDRYGGAAYGNMSARLNPFPGERRRRRFVVTGTQTSGKRVLSADDFCLVEAYDYDTNDVQSLGPVLPSSESLTHGAVYDLSPTIRCVIHAHAPAIWQRTEALRLPRTHDHIAYGSVDMAREVHRLYRTSSLASRHIFAMGGHEDGVVAFGRSANEAADVLLSTLARAYEHSFVETGSLVA